MASRFQSQVMSIPWEARPQTFIRALVLSLALLPLPYRPAGSQLRDTDEFVQGVVTDAVTGEPVAFAIISVEGTRRSVLTDHNGQFELELDPGTWIIGIRKIGYRMERREVTIANLPIRVDIALRPIPVELTPIRVMADRDNPALPIIRQAIARKNDLLSRIHDYRYDAYVKFVVRDLGKHRDSVESVVLITESKTTAYWEQPGEYQEIIQARRQSSNLDPENNLVSVGQIVNFNRDRIDLQKYSVVSPTADDALEFYDYFIVDTLTVDGRRVWRLAIEPKSHTRPLFVGVIDIADSTFNVLSVNVGANEAIRFDFFRGLRYQQKLGAVGEDAWMPMELRFSGELHIGVPIPGFPNHLEFEHTAALRNFRFDEGEAPGTLGEYLIVVDQNADESKSTDWDASRSKPLSRIEQAAWMRIDSLENLPDPLGEKLLTGAGTVISLTSNRDFFHFNRVEGPYLGAGLTLREISPRLILRGKTGRAFDSELWQHHYGMRYRVSDRRRIWLGGNYRDEIVRRPTVISTGLNSTYPALFSKEDPLDYYLERGFHISVASKLVDFVQLALWYNDVEHRSAQVVTQYSFFEKDARQRPNPPVSEGRLRSWSGTLSYDSRPRLKAKGRDYLLNSFTYVKVVLGAEYTRPELLDSDFDFVRFHADVRLKQRLLNFGLTSLRAFVGGASGQLPAQRYFNVDFGSSALVFQEGGFNTLAEQNFSGNRIGMFRLSHDFGRQLFRRSDIPLLRDVPVTLSVHGGMFWTEFIDHDPNPGDVDILAAPSAYVELGFGVGNLTPILAPLNLKVWMTWQLSSYDTDPFRFSIGVPSF